MTSCLMAPSHHPNQCWLIISEIQWYSPKGKDNSTINLEWGLDTVLYYKRPCHNFYMKLDTYFHPNNFVSIYSHTFNYQLGHIYLMPLNSLAPWILERDFGYVIFLLNLVIHYWYISCETAIKWMPRDLTYDKSTLVQLGAIRQQTITCANVDRDLCSHMASLGHNELIQMDSKITSVLLDRDDCMYRSKILWYDILCSYKSGLFWAA